MSDFTPHPEFGPYLGIFGDTKVALTRGNITRNFRFAGYHAFSAGGLIGSEHNGIVIVDDDAKTRLADKVLCQSSSYNGNFKAVISAEIARIAKMGASEFETYVTSQEQCRFPAGIFDALRTSPTADPYWIPQGTKRPPAPTTPAALREIRRITENRGHFTFEDKEKFHARGQLVLKRLAKMIGLPSGTFEVRSNRAGSAVLGEVTLHAEYIYIQFGDAIQGSFMYRGCKSRTDYSGGPNQWMTYKFLTEHTNKAAEEFRAVFKKARAAANPALAECV